MNLGIEAPLQARQAEILPVLLARADVINARDGYSFPEGEIARRAAASLNAFAKTLSEDPPTTFIEYWRAAGYARFQSGVSLEHMQDILRMAIGTYRRFLTQVWEGYPATQLEALTRCQEIGEAALIALHQAYLRAKDELIEAQQARIRQLSTPIIPVYPGVLVLPLIGAIDAERAREMIARLLDEVSRNRAVVVIIDLTGVPVIDAGVARHLLQAAQASELLGSQVVFVGIRPDAAPALLSVEVNFSSLRTLANLQAGIAYALGVLDLEIRPRARESFGALPGRGAARPPARPKL